MAERTLTQRTVVPATDPVRVIDWLADLRHTVGLQPLIESAELVADRPGDAADTTTWRITERPRLGRWGFRIRFTATVRRVSPTQVHTQVKAALGTRLVTQVHATPFADGSGVEVVQVLTATAPAATIGYVIGQARAAHTEAFRRLPGLLA